MKLIFLLQKNAWFVEFEQSWFRLHDLHHVELALAGLMLKVADQFQLIEQPHHAGSASIKQRAKDILCVQLKGPDGVVVDNQEIKLNKQSLVSVDWVTRPYRDGWISASAELVVDNVNDFYVNAYLPQKKNSDGKMLTVHNSRDDSMSEIWLARETKTRVQLVAKGRSGKTTLHLNCEPETVSRSSDARQLGFVLLDERVCPV